MKKGNLKYDFNGDDLGSCYYTFYGATIAEAVNHALENVDLYKIVHIESWVSIWRCGTRITKIVLEDPAKIKRLEGSQHFSKSYNDK
jgi:hypothetical protein